METDGLVVEWGERVLSGSYAWFVRKGVDSTRLLVLLGVSCRFLGLDCSVDAFLPDSEHRL